MERNTRQMVVAIGMMLALAGALVLGFVGCDYRAPSDLEPEAPSPLPAVVRHIRPLPR
jgi:hypothetical protein